MNFQQKIMDLLMQYLMQYGTKLLGALIVLAIGLWATGAIVRIVDNILKKSRIDISLHFFIKSFLGIGLKIVLFITAAAMLGIPMTTFIAVLSAAGLAVGLALKDNLSNLAGGILILAFRPFRVGDYIETQGYQGTVKEIQLLYTCLNTPDNKVITIPNGELSNSKIVNYSAEKMRRVDLVFKISYKDDLLKAKEILTKIVNEHPLILKEPEPLIRVVEHAANSINFAVRVWCENENYWPIYYDLHEQVKLVFDKEGISIPLPQMDVRVINNGS